MEFGIAMGRFWVVKAADMQVMSAKIKTRADDDWVASIFLDFDVWIEAIIESGLSRWRKWRFGTQQSAIL